VARSSSAHERPRDSDVIEAGRPWMEVLEDQLRHADTLIFIGTRASFLSEHIRYELEFFNRRRELRIIPIMFRGGLI
jgi:nucleotide-binding universal stress UspA family protein